ncbi:MAG: hypothetical protein MRZ28_03740 [Oscillospiraceae bacterium]|jgi:hypothetical protein|nr:hypothetical protein [Oscillospiraceae bacterium]MDY3219802.1 hypothetical protein [Candidatus Fimivivens sp.]
MDRSELLKTKHMFEFQKLARDLRIAKFSEFEEAEMKHFVTFFPHSPDETTTEDVDVPEVFGPSKRMRYDDK